MYARKHIYFKTKEAHDFFMQQSNRSAYVEELILQDLHKDKKEVTMEELKNLIQELKKESC